MILLIFVLFGSGLLVTSSLLARALWDREPATKGMTYHGLNLNYTFRPNILNTFNNLFPIYSYQKEVCRRPSGLTFSLLDSKFKPFSITYQFQGYSSFKTLQLGSHFHKIEGAGIYKNGNALLLIPQSYIAPSEPNFQPENIPQIVVPKAD